MVERGPHVIRLDNRDSGRSTHMSDAPAPNLPAALAGDLSSASYTLSHMAADAVGLLDALELPAAHVVGGPMGGAIAQTLAIEHPKRVLSLTSMMSTTGDPAVGQPDPATAKEVFGGPPAVSRRSPGRPSRPSRPGTGRRRCARSTCRRSSCTASPTAWST